MQVRFGLGSDSRIRKELWQILGGMSMDDAKSAPSPRCICFATSGDFHSSVAMATHILAATML